MIPKRRDRLTLRGCSGPKNMSSGLTPAIMVKQWVSDKPVSNCETGLISDFKDIHKILLLGKKRRTQPSPWIVRAKSGKAGTDL
jgi:hypothetical protein